MPKKLSTNPKAAEARERKEEKKKSERERIEKQKEDAYWEDNDKHVLRKQNRKGAKDQKKQEELQKKQERRKLLEEEEAQHTSKPSGAAKVTRAGIATEQDKIAKKNLKAAASAKSAEEQPFEGENPNQKMAQLLAEEGATEARSVEDAITVLSIGDSGGVSVDKHPEKRMKAAYAAFEEREIPRLKQENPNLRMSQLKQLLRKEWMKSPDNPINQALRS